MRPPPPPVSVSPPPPSAVTVPLPANVPASIHTEPAAPPPLSWTPFAFTEPSTVTVGAVIRIAPPPSPPQVPPQPLKPLPPAEPIVVGSFTEPYEDPPAGV